MGGGDRLWCAKCQRMTRHSVESGVTSDGVTWQHERCGECRATSAPFSGAHEIPNVAPAAPLDSEVLLASVGLTHRGKHLVYLRWLIARGHVSDGCDQHLVNELRRRKRERVANLAAGLNVYGMKRT